VAQSFFLDTRSEDFNEKITAMFKSLDGQDPLLSALIGAAHIDKCLIALLEHFLVRGRTTKQKHLSLDSDNSGILLTLYTRAEFAYMLGLITSEMLNNIKTICTIRNKFAHSHIPLHFDSEEIFNLCKDLRVPGAPKNAPYPIPGEEYDISDYANYQNLPRNRFTDAVSLTVMNLARLPAKLERLKTPYIDGEPSK
jgi:DNA-binding MltR family transcriptional regulator